MMLTCGPSSGCPLLPGECGLALSLLMLLAPCPGPCGVGREQVDGEPETWRPGWCLVGVSGRLEDVWKVLVSLLLLLLLLLLLDSAFAAGCPLGG